MPPLTAYILLSQVPGCTVENCFQRTQCQWPPFEYNYFKVIISKYDPTYVCVHEKPQFYNQTSVYVVPYWLFGGNFHRREQTGYIIPSHIEFTVAITHKEYVKFPKYHLDLGGPIFAVLFLSILTGTVFRGVRSLNENVSYAARFIFKQIKPPTSGNRVWVLPLSILSIFYASMCDNIILSNTLATLTFPFKNSHDMARLISEGKLRPLRVKTNKINSMKGISHFVRSQGYGTEHMQFVDVANHKGMEHINALNENPGTFDIHTNGFFRYARESYYDKIDATRWGSDWAVIGYYAKGPRLEIDKLNVQAWRAFEVGVHAYLNCKYGRCQRTANVENKSPRHQALPLDLSEFMYIAAALIFLSTAQTAAEIARHSMTENFILQ